ncbi:4-(cytidine 5'-diphospho)-2-C-methyl-D-erythritol kinase [Sedimentibacter sp. MB31-C6]|uniref:4-(cytidine 5'-diphospho)-2-C-methyl-D-erythritol kinase n=1 Tax=Sedimentibacter sp. MB31-C6 TaxID=3109366 RepID=UPI002DDD787F|nr:4-(cytidine 5'-diphospho)-2-C-methyl-D-erythritol kinase [Sedimentibacter sp. MB36-C1]WSI03308.1 4-(cytidine 5'-diphospho)-2-C-methyl-D-erythritol kinase [Sedimentibacter sp. MB36-C1]
MIKLYSYGKINLFLDIEGKFNNGYHSIKTVMQSIDLHDEIILEQMDNNQIILECSDPKIPIDIKNTCVKAASIIKNKYNIETGLHIKLKKTIPSEAGLAGGSSNSAALIIGLNKLWKLNLSHEELIDIGLMVGADVPFCLMGGTYLAKGIGEKLLKLENFIWNNILIIKPNFSLSTAFVYQNLLPEYYNFYSNNEIIKYIKNKRYIDTVKSTANTLEKVVEEIYPEINEIKKLLYKNNAISSNMTGSGSAVFGMFENEKTMDDAYNNLKPIYPEIFKTKTINKGYEFIV